MKSLVFLSCLVFMVAAKNIKFDRDFTSLMQDEAHPKQAERDLDDVIQYDDNNADVSDDLYERELDDKKKLKARCVAIDHKRCHTEPYMFSKKCSIKNVRYQLCPHVCGTCRELNGEPAVPVCPDSFKFGCCFDGTEATDMHKNCPVCKDLNPCVLQGKYRCTNSVSSKLIRKLCPVLCNMCGQYGNTCVDSHPEKCANITDPSECEGNGELQRKCVKTCDLCSNPVGA